VHDLDTVVGPVRIAALSLPPIFVQLPFGEGYGYLLAIRRPESTMGKDQIDFLDDLPCILAVHVHNPDAVPFLDRLAGVRDLSAIRRKPRVTVESSFGQPALLGPVRLHHVELVAAAVGRVTIGDGDGPFGRRETSPQTGRNQEWAAWSGCRRS